MPSSWDVLSLILLSIFTVSPTGLPSASAAFLNVTIDDTFGDPTTGNQVVYAPQGAWQSGLCTGCATTPNPSQVSNGTWHEATFNPNATKGSDQLLTAAVSFEGVAVYVFCVVTYSFTAPVGNSDMTFFLDGILVGKFEQPPNGNAAYEYDVPVYVNESLPLGQHTIVVANGQVGGTTSLTLLDHIVYTRDINSTTSSPAALTPTKNPLSVESTAGSSVTFMAASTTSSSNRTVVIAVVVSIAGLLVLIAVFGAIIYFRRRRSRARGGSQNGVIAPDAVPIGQENPNASGWVEGTWVGEDDSDVPSVGGTRRTLSNGRRKRGPSGSSASVPSLPTTPSTRSLNKPFPVVSNIQISRLPFSRPDPVSPSSSFGNMGSAPPNSAGFFIPPRPPVSSTLAAPPRPPRPTESDTFLDMGQSFTDSNLSTLPTHTAHPFATAQSYTPSPLSYARQRSDTNTSTTIPPPSASTGALAAATRGARSGPDLTEHESTYTHAGALLRKRSGSDTTTSSPYPRVDGTTAQRQRSGSDLEVNYGYRRAGPFAPTRKRSGSDLESNYVSTPAISPKTYASTAASTVTSPTSMTALVPKRHVGEKPSAGELSGSQAQGTALRAATAPRRVDPVDPSLQPPRDKPLARGPSSRERQRERNERPGAQAEPSRSPGQGENQPPTQEQAQALARARSGRRVGLVMSDRDRQRFGFLDVPQDAADSRPPSYREADR